MSLTKEQKEQADRITAVMMQKDETGEFVYTQDEVRDFIVACIFEMGLPLDNDLEKVLLKFCQQFELPEDISDEDLVAVIKEYFEENPLNPGLLKEMEDLGRGDLLARDEGYKDAASKVNTLRSTGKQEDANAPVPDPVKKPGVKPKRGLS
jgi:hypothetical protein